MNDANILMSVDTNEGAPITWKMVKETYIAQN